MSTHLTIKNENRPIREPFSLVLVPGDMICFVVKSENLKGLAMIFVGQKNPFIIFISKEIQ